VTPVGVQNARRVAPALLGHRVAKDHLQHQLEWGRPLPVVAREAEGIYRSFYRQAFGTLPAADRIAWVMVAILVRDALSGKRAEDDL
jgi:hypothetical protein